MMRVCFKTVSDFCGVASKLLRTGTLQLGADLKSRNTSSGVISAPLGLNIEPLHIDLARFCAVIKKLDGENLDLEFEPTRIVLSQSGARVVFPVLEAEAWDSPCLGSPVSNDWALALEACEGSIETLERFGGVLIDTTGEYPRAVKFNNFAIAIRTLTAIPDKLRIVVPSQFLKSLGGQAEVMLNANFFGLRFDTGVIAYTTLLHDALPQSYLELARVSDTPQMIQAANYDWYCLAKHDLLAALKIEGAAMGTTRSFIDFEFVRNDKSMVCNIRSQDFGYEMRKSIECQEFKSDKVSDLISIKGSDLLNTLSYLDDRVVIYNDGTGPILVGSEGKISVFSRVS